LSFIIVLIKILYFKYYTENPFQKGKYCNGLKLVLKLYRTAAGAINTGAATKAGLFEARLFKRSEKQLCLQYTKNFA